MEWVFGENSQLENGIFWSCECWDVRSVGCSDVRCVSALSISLMKTYRPCVLVGGIPSSTSRTSTTFTDEITAITSPPTSTSSISHIHTLTNQPQNSLYGARFSAHHSSASCRKWSYPWGLAYSSVEARRISHLRGSCRRSCSLSSIKCAHLR